MLEPPPLGSGVIKPYRMPLEEREVLGRRGREYVEEHHDIRKLVERLERVLMDVVHGP